MINDDAKRMALAFIYEILDWKRQATTVYLKNQTVLRIRTELYWFVTNNSLIEVHRSQCICHQATDPYGRFSSESTRTEVTPALVSSAGEKCGDRIPLAHKYLENPWGLS